MTARPANGNGFAQKALVVILGVIMTALMAFFVWLATAVIDIRERVTRIEVHVSSLLETRKDDTLKADLQTNDRVNNLEQNSGN